MMNICIALSSLVLFLWTLKILGGSEAQSRFAATKKSHMLRIAFAGLFFLLGCSFLPSAPPTAPPLLFGASAIASIWEISVLGWRVAR
jgi:hypothetical protein